MQNSFIFCGPSGSGKTSIIKNLLNLDPRLKLSVSYTTRRPRSDACDGFNYNFITKDKFFQLKETGEIIEDTVIHNNHYGSPKIDGNGKDLLYDVDTYGYFNIIDLFNKHGYTKPIGIFITTNSLAELHSRILYRDNNSEEAERRITAAKSELLYINSFKYIIINDKLKNACMTAHSIIKATRAETCNNKNIINNILGEING